jgi:hypothetical protein
VSNFLVGGKEHALFLARLQGSLASFWQHFSVNGYSFALSHLRVQGHLFVVKLEDLRKWHNRAEQLVEGKQPA